MAQHVERAHVHGEACHVDHARCVQQVGGHHRTHHGDGAEAEADKALREGRQQHHGGSEGQRFGAHESRSASKGG